MWCFVSTHLVFERFGLYFLSFFCSTFLVIFLFRVVFGWVSSLGTN